MCFRICTLNIGSNSGDYELLCARSGLQIEKSKLESTYNTVQSVMASRIADKADVFCLQEVYDENRPLIQALKEKKFVIIHAGTKRFSSAAIALNPEKFEDITSCCIKGFDVAFAFATEKVTKQRIAFASAHVLPLTLEGTVDKGEAKDGDDYCQRIVDELLELNCTMHIVGADVNANPEKWLPRFEKFTSNQFEVIRKGSATSYNPRSAHYKEREIDFIFVRTVKNQTNMNYGVKFDDVQSITWDPQTNASDHLPVFASVFEKNCFQKFVDSVMRILFAIMQLFVRIITCNWKEKTCLG